MDHVPVDRDATPGPARRLLDRLRSEEGSALLLLGAALVALLWANSPVSGAYVHLWETPVVVEAGALRFDMDLHHWVNDGLMVVFFFVVGLEVRQELALGSLRQRRHRLVPLVAGTVGVLVPAAIYLAVAGGTAPEGWGVVVGTDTAFLLGVLALVGPAMSNQLRVFLLTLSVVDDFLAVTIIGVVYSDEVRVGPLALAGACLVVLWLLGRTREWRSGPYVVAVVVLWGATVQAGVHPSLAGMLAGLLVPAAATERTAVLHAKSLFRDYWQSPDAGAARTVRLGLARSISVNQRLHEALRAPVSLVVVPVFALANAGIDLRGDALGAAFGSVVLWGVVAGLVVGKLVGICLGTWAALRMRLGGLPDGVGPGSVVGGAALSGIGFTVSLLIVDLAFDDEAAAQAATVGVLVAMVASSLVGWAAFRVARVRFGETSADLPVTLTPPVDVGRDHVHGNPEAPFTVVEYLDFQCPFCARATGTWADLRDHFGDRIRYVVRHLPLEDVHPQAFVAALAAEAAHRQGRFWEMHDVLFANQARLELEDLRGYAAELGLDLERFDADLADPELAERVRSDAESGGAGGARGTPTFFLNGVRHRGPHDARTLVAALEASTPDVSARRRS
ncbi:Na+/H+ antiporter NhaA [Isoptericola variabilis]|uniref:Na(+)/H(+) antiporter NhaA n=1 Tax=Isoptericola variabilis (strain 225) TaxID=743718 RepID=F6FVX7_ISOV2|nr:Na+/H+ antiporter NhaA [Isoptericola variabilis]AEG44447.1 Na(+)/H(+) antiporter nhaA [Isoptericola variabilis 225]